MFTGVSRPRNPRTEAKISKWIESLINKFKALCRSLRVNFENLISEPTWDSLAHITLLEDIDVMKPKVKQLEKLKKETKGAQLLDIEECIQIFENILNDHDKAKSGKRCSLDIMLIQTCAY